MTLFGESDGPVRRVTTRGGAEMPALGLGTWRMGEDRAARTDEVAALRLGLDLGIGLIDTAELYGDGGAEEVAGEAIKGRRDEVFLVSKVLPANASRQGTLEAAEGSLRRLGTDRIDLYLLHWAGPHHLQDTLDAFAQLVDEQKILHYGVSNLDAADMAACEALRGGSGVVANQVIYNLNRRGVEWDLLPWCREHEVAMIAYSPLDDGRLVSRPGLAAVARRHGTTIECVALAWTLRQPWVVSIPKATNPEHVKANRAAASLALTDEDLTNIDGDFPPPDRPAQLVIDPPAF